MALRQAREIEKQEQPAPKSKPSDFIEVISVGGKKAPTAEQVVQKDIEPKTETDQFADNKLFTADKVAAARARLKSKFGRLNSGIDPEIPTQTIDNLYPFFYDYTLYKCHICF